LEAVSPPGLHGDLDREPRRQYRHLDVASSWLMTTLSPDPLIVSLVQVAASLPIFLLAIPAGALADIIDRRRCANGLMPALIRTRISERPNCPTGSIATIGIGRMVA
jgi:hypothetical protein